MKNLAKYPTLSKIISAANKFTEEQQDALCEEAMQKFGAGFWCKPGYEWGSGAVFWTGEGASMPDDRPAYDPYASSKDYLFGIHPELEKWAKSKGFLLENYDSGTILGYPL